MHYLVSPQNCIVTTLFFLFKNSEAMTKKHTTSLMISDECTAMSFAPIVSLAPCAFHQFPSAIV